MRQGLLSLSLFICGMAAAGFPAAASPEGDDPFADSIVDFDLGAGGSPSYTDPFTVLGSPERFTGEGVFPVVVSPFSPPFGTDEILSLGDGGFITVQFNTPVVDDPLNPFGIDLLIFNNTGFIDGDFPNGLVSGLFGNEGGTIEVSADGVNWSTIPGIAADAMFPTNGYLDSGPYDDTPGSVPSDFTRPVDPSLTFDDFNGLTYQQALALYDGSGGGVGVDLSTVDLPEISFVRVSYSGVENIEIDAFADVLPIPGPAGMAALLGGLAGGRRRRRSGGDA